MIRITCPNCGASGQLDESRKPAGTANINCPRCKHSFPLLPSNKADFSYQEQPRAVPTPVPSAGPPTTSTAADEPPKDLASCIVCNGNFDVKSLEKVNDNLVCAGCKPMYEQMLSLGLTSSVSKHYGGFWIRFAAKLVDGLILWAVNMGINMALMMAIGKTHSPKLVSATAIFIALIQIIIGVAYYIYFLASNYQATPGKMICNLKVVNEQGDKISTGQAAGRYFAEILSGLILMIGYIMAAFDPEKRTLHDKICKTRVVYK